MKALARVAAAVLALAVLAPLARAQDKDWKWDPKAKKKAKAGRKSVEEGETIQKEASTITVDQQEVKKENKEEKVAFKVHKEVKAVSDDKVTEELIKVEKFTRTATDEEEDKSLEGQTVVVTTKDGKKSYTLPDDKEGKVSEGAKAWVEEHFAKKKKKKGDEDDKDEKKDDDEEGMSKFFPSKPIVEGDEWTNDPGELAKAMFGEDGLVDPAKSSVKGKLTKVRVEDGAHLGHIEVKIVLKLKSLPNMPKEMEFQWTDGGVFEMTVVLDGSLEPEKSDAGSYNIDGSLTGKAKFSAQGQDAHLKMNVKQKIAVKSSAEK